MVFAAFCVASSAAMSEEEFYTRVFEEVDPDFILDNERILQSYLKCFYSEVECNAHAEVVKSKCRIAQVYHKKKSRIVEGQLLFK